MYIILYNSLMEYIGTLYDVSYEINRRAYDLDTSSFSGITDEGILNDAFFFIIKNEVDFEYSGWLKNFKQDGKLVTFNGVDLKSALDTEVELDFNETIEDYFTLGGIVNSALSKRPNTMPNSNFIKMVNTTDIVAISNFSLQVIRVNILQFIKPYLVLNNYFIDSRFDEKTKTISFEIINNDKAMTLYKDDFILETTTTSTGTNEAMASLIQVQKEDTDDEISFIPTSKYTYDNAEIKERVFGRFTENLNNNVVTEVSTRLFSETIAIDFDETDMVNYLNNNDNKGYMFIPYHHLTTTKTVGFKKATIDFEVGAQVSLYRKEIDLFTGKTIVEYDNSPSFNKIFTTNGDKLEEAGKWLELEIKYEEFDSYYFYNFSFILNLTKSDLTPLEKSELEDFYNKNTIFAKTPFDIVIESDKGKYGSPLIDYIPQDMFKTCFQVKLPSGLYSIRNTSPSTPINEGKYGMNAEVFQEESRLPLDRIKIYAGKTLATKDLVFDKGKVIFNYVDNIRLLGIKKDIRSNRMFTFDFGSFGQLYINSNGTINATGSGNWFYDIEIEGFENYWQVGQLPKREKRLLHKRYYLGKNNQVYEGSIPESEKIFPAKVKYFQDEFLFKAQQSAISELVNSRFDLSFLVYDNDSVNPYKLSRLGLLAQVEVVGKNGSIVLPISEIIYSNTREQQVKLGFKKMLFTELIKE